MATPYATVRLESVASTQDEARGRFAGTPVLVVADLQVDGRGRSGNDWWQASRPLNASLALDVDWPPASLPVLPLVAGLAAVDVFDIHLKWPNDLVVVSRLPDGTDALNKVGGVLVETATSPGEPVVVGMGVNLYWPEAPTGAGGLHDADPGDTYAASAAARWVEALLSRTDRGPEAWGRSQYRSRCVTIGQRVSWQHGGRPRTGVAADIGETGGLVVDTTVGRETLTSGEVRELRTATLRIAGTE